MARSHLSTSSTLPAFHQSNLQVHAAAAAWTRRRVPPTRRRVVPAFMSDPRQGEGGMEFTEPSLEESLDAIDDVFMDRLPGEGREKVKIFGAWLDADVAGRKAGQGNRAAGLIARMKNGEELTDQEKAEIFYEEAIALMRRRDCDASVALLDKAVDLAGADSRRGGEFKLWAAQALQGVNRNNQAVEVLKSLKSHRDFDVRKVSAELLYIAQAPQLALNGEDFVDFPDTSGITDDYDKKDLGKPKIAPWKKSEKEEDMFYVGEDTGVRPGNDPVMFLAAIVGILGLSYMFLV
ncbi:conserved unknown protein [Ectocarpus siliculosus]|uniref:Uncharacterized protein n=1 Tax=Ectocarpus siliculosus TaxID=2880 RepID=D7FPX2_ECTSI|nr:conserved unknown protein [Ectocarpus siliculosus]|eukprot:CBJ48304.1 conserved unknown protein [Ectocarpus siliculosus]